MFLKFLPRVFCPWGLWDSLMLLTLSGLNIAVANMNMNKKSADSTWNNETYYKLRNKDILVWKRRENIQKRIELCEVVDFMKNRQLICFLFFKIFKGSKTMVGSTSKVFETVYYSRYELPPKKSFKKRKHRYSWNFIWFVFIMFMTRSKSTNERYKAKSPFAILLEILEYG